MQCFIWEQDYASKDAFFPIHLIVEGKLGLKICDQKIEKWGKGVRKVPTKFQELFIWPIRPGVSNTRPAGCICAARERLKILIKINFFEIFPYKLRPAEHFFLGMWPTNRFDFETPALDH